MGINASLRDAQLARGKAERGLEPQNLVTQAEMIRVRGSVVLPHRPGYVWARTLGVPCAAYWVLNRGIEPREGIPIFIQRSPKAPYPWQVIGVDWQRVEQNPNVNDPTDPFLQSHHRTHEQQDGGYFGSDVVNVFLRMLAPLKTSPAAGLTVSVYSFRYLYDGTERYFAGATLSLAGHVPAGDLARYVLVYLDMATGELGTVDGLTMASSSTTLPQPTAPAGGVSSAWVRLQTLQTAIAEADIVDARKLFGYFISDNSGGESTVEADRLPMCGARRRT
jgi:hypothetical protein